MLVVGAMVSLAGCGSNPTQLAELAPPRNQLEGLNRIKAGNAKHDETAPANQKSFTTPSNPGRYARRR
jgi:hypothetical protein